MESKKMSKDQIKVNGQFETPSALRAPAVWLALRLVDIVLPPPKSWGSPFHSLCPSFTCQRRPVS